MPTHILAFDYKMEGSNYVAHRQTATAATDNSSNDNRELNGTISIINQN